eukprot:TRINITY_DN11594_c0_g1_i1.p1 TRINITY_DN11594_c0_g1~~TRINITY_DN11594_c0_g1_i1.p1  ORF type:complete len:1424 (-),score=259.03 TRINITY_DN11594_c0_g1_i1:51-4322(-)
MGSKASRNDVTAFSPEDEESVDESDGDHPGMDLLNPAIPKRKDDIRKHMATAVTRLQDLSSRVSFNLCLGRVRGSTTEPFFVIVYTRKAADSPWIELGTTETKLFTEDAQELRFVKEFEIKFCISKACFVRFEVYKMRAPSNDSDLRSQKFLGCTEARIVEMMRARSKGSGWLVRDLHHPIREQPAAKLCIYAEEDEDWKQLLSFDLCGHSVKSPDFWKGRPDAFCVVKQVAPGSTGAETRSRAVVRTEVARSTNEPRWDRVQFRTAELWPESRAQDVLVEVYDWARTGKNGRVGDSWLNFQNVMRAIKETRTYVVPILSRRKKLVHENKKAASFTSGMSQVKREVSMIGRSNDLVGYLSIARGGAVRTFSFLDFIRSNMEIRLMFAIDFTRSNGAPENSSSLHNHPTSADPNNAYISIIKGLADLMQYYDSDPRFSVYGLGARIPPTKSVDVDVFAVNGDFFSPEVDGAEGIIDAYRRALRIVRLHGPTRLSPLVRLTTKMVLPAPVDPKVVARGKRPPPEEQRFTVVLILTDGGVNKSDHFALVEALVEAANAPVAYVVVGISASEEDARFFSTLPAKVREARIVAGVPEKLVALRSVLLFENFDKAIFTSQELEAAAGESLRHMPQEVIGYFATKETKPQGLERFEDESGRKPMNKDSPFKTQDDEKLKPPKKRGKAGGIAGSSRTTSTLSTSSCGSAGTGSNPGSKGAPTQEQDMAHERRKKEAEEKKRLQKRLPPCLLNMSDELCKQARKLGYTNGQLERVFVDGVPSGSIDMLVDCITNTGYNVGMSYKEAASRALEGIIEEPRPRHDTLDEATASVIVNQFRELAHCDRVFVYVFDKSKNQFRVFGSHMQSPVIMDVLQGIPNLVLVERESLMIADCYKDYRFDQREDRAMGYTTKSMLAVPVLYGGRQRVWGILQAVNKVARETELSDFAAGASPVSFKSADREAVTVFAKDLGALATEGSVNEESILVAADKAEAMKERLMRSAVALTDDVIRVFLSRLQMLFRCDRASFFVYNQEDELFMLHGTCIPEPRPFLAGTGIVGAVFEDQDTTNISDLSQDTRFDNSFDLRTGYTSKSMVATAVVVNNETFGVLQILNKLPRNADMDDPSRHLKAIAFTQEDRKSLEAMSACLASQLAAGKVDVDILTREAASKSASIERRISTAVNSRSTTTLSRSVSGSSPARSHSFFNADDDSDMQAEAPSCAICFERTAVLEILPCRHGVFCQACAPKAGSRCLVCTEPVEKLCNLPVSSRCRSKFTGDMLSLSRHASKRSSLTREGSFSPPPSLGDFSRSSTKRGSMSRQDYLPTLSNGELSRHSPQRGRQEIGTPTSVGGSSNVSVISLRPISHQDLDSRTSSSPSISPTRSLSPVRPNHWAAAAPSLQDSPAPPALPPSRGPSISPPGMPVVLRASSGGA